MGAEVGAVLGAVLGTRWIYVGGDVSVSTTDESDLMAWPGVAVSYYLDRYDDQGCQLAEEPTRIMNLA